MDGFWDEGCDCTFGGWYLFGGGCVGGGLRPCWCCDGNIISTCCMASLMILGMAFYLCANLFMFMVVV